MLQTKIKNRNDHGGFGPKGLLNIQWNNNNNIRIGQTASQRGIDGCNIWEVPVVNEVQTWFDVHRVEFFHPVGRSD